MDNKLKQDHYKVKVTEQQETTQYKTGRGAQINTKNRFLKNEKTKEHIEAIDDWEKRLCKHSTLKPILKLL